MLRRQNSTRLFEICAVVVTGVCKFIFVDIYPAKFWYILCTVAFWSAYVSYRAAAAKDVFRHWGFRVDTFGAYFRTLAPFAIPSIVAFAVYGVWADTITFNVNIIPVLILYPAWGVIQQFLVIGLIAGNLNDMQGWHMPRPVNALVTAFIFSIVHYPSWMLIVGTFVLALIYTPLYLRYRNIWAPGILHGWLACFFYYFVLGRDAWAEVVRTL